MVGEPLKFIVIGAGIAGLTTAYLLNKAGHKVIMVEKSSQEADRWHGGLRCPPNMTRLFQDLPGAQKLLNEKAMKCAGLHFFQCKDKTSELVGKMEFTEDMMNDLGCDFYFIPASVHRDLHKHLLTLCMDADVQICWSLEVEEICLGKDINPIVIFKGGERISGDIVIGADGKKSVARNGLLVEEDEELEYHPLEDSSDMLPMKELTGATVSIPISIMEQDPDLLQLTRSEHWMFWMGNGTVLMGAPYGRDLYVLDLAYAGPPGMDDKDMEWLTGAPIENVFKHLNEYDPRLKRIFQLASKSHWSIQTVYDLPRYISRDNEVVLIGDAAHAVHIHGTYNTAAAFEDAFTLGRLFSERESARSHVPLLLDGYQTIRHTRTRKMELACMHDALILGVPRALIAKGGTTALD
ncbi:FAD/NAD(P)-binding domain-containing protein [Gymnopus androsaceus JB14]|uniref:FAD/NAD(P)-binding domain-containing protein n=1 Tax=Gymnopus androsaceus JB14 TaxID=1447944 RepID=A0A6A4GLJ2_9AGAR|nr:FAD/NAD(P)-binding domain-containing protein [Gymnopus androsaceus JB14]